MINFLGDTHGRIDHVIEIVQRDRPVAVVFLGDLECQQPLHELIAPVRDLTEIWWIPGNHDSDGPAFYRNLFESELADRNLSGRIVEIAGLRVAGLGGIFRGDIWFPPDAPKHSDYAEWASVQRMKGGQKRRLTKMDLCQLQAVPASTADIQSLSSDGRLRKHRTSIFFAEYERLYGQAADLFVTHEAPSCHPHGFAAIDELAQSMGVQAAFHGHHHDNLDYQRFDAAFGFRAFGVGFCGITDQNGRVIRAGDFDEARRYRAAHPVFDKRDATFRLNVSVVTISLIGDDRRLDIELQETQPGRETATQILDFLSPYRLVTFIRDDEAAEVLLLSLLGKRAPAHISFRGSDE